MEKYGEVSQHIPKIRKRWPESRQIFQDSATAVLLNLNSESFHNTKVWGLSIPSKSLVKNFQINEKKEAWKQKRGGAVEWLKGEKM